MKKLIIMVGGGDSYSNREDFLNALRTNELRDVPSVDTYTSWKKWLIEELGDEYWVDRPQMPNTHNAHYDEWKIWFERHAELIEKEVILIGHSLGAMFLAKYISENAVSCTINHLFLLAGPCGYYDDGAGNDCGSFQFEASDLSHLSEKVEAITIMHSKDDFVVPYEHALKFKEALPEAELVTFEDKNHFLIEEFSELLARIRSLTE